jgi:hypothetical protein
MGISIELLGLAALAVFVAYVYTRTRAAGWLGVAALAGGTIMVALKLASATPALTIYLLRDDMTAGTAQMLSVLSVVLYMIHVLPAGIFVACGAAAAMITHSLGRVLGWAGVVIGVAGVVTAAVVGYRIQGVFSPTFLLAAIWMLVVSLRWGFARNGTKPPALP